MSVDLDSFDLGLFGPFAEAGHAGLRQSVRDVTLELKSVEQRRAEAGAASDMRPILNEAVLELKDQFETFRRLRSAAESMLDGGDDAAQKLARADIKAATDAMSLIVRTLEKIDTLQRQLARDRQDEAERAAEAGSYQEALLEVDRLIDERAQERYRQRCRAAGLDPDEPGGAAGEGPPLPDTG
ncbi:hypothetical protein ACQKKX_18585 [Neorhizobium sp. NPDC001467]|uniref:hypothetical protein n=1 Tax=Neorhizobium sp. NPDC001467 TaxID=3390595 RepID=UPI003D0213C8